MQSVKLPLSGAALPGFKLSMQVNGWPIPDDGVAKMV